MGGSHPISWRLDFGHLMGRTDSLAKTLILGKVEGRRRRGWQRIRWLDGIIDTMNMSLSKLWEIVKDRERRTQLSNSTTIPDLCDWKTWWWESLDSSDRKRHREFLGFLRAGHCVLDFHIGLLVCVLLCERHRISYIWFMPFLYIG